MKTVQFNANNILCGNNYPIAYYYPIAKDLVVISTGPIPLSMTLWDTQNISFLS